VLVLALLVAACDARLGATRDGIGVDARGGGGGGSDAGPPIDAPTTAACFNGRVIFLNFDGVVLQLSAVDDAAQDHARWIGVPQAAIPPYHANNQNRANQIQTITDAVRAALAGFPITVVTQRPAAGPYVMIAFGGDSQTVGTVYSGAASYHDCGDATKSDVGWVADKVGVTKAADYAVGAVGWALGLQGTGDPDDCMCNWANQCQQSSSHCVLHGPISTTPSQAPASTCPGLSTQDENATFKHAFCD
jgi:hypothetical protein